MIERYLWELRRALGRRLPSDVLMARLREAEGHLRAAATEFGEEEAVRRYGSARLAAHGIVRTHRGYATASAWRLAFGVGLALLAGFAFPLLWMDLLLRREQSLEWAILACRWAPFLVLIAFGLRAAQTRRWLATPATAWLAAGWLFYAGGNVLFPPFPTGSAAKPSYDRTIRYYNAQSSRIDAWRKGSPPPDQAPQPFPVTEIVVVPLTPFQYERSLEPDLELGKARSAEESRRLWERYGPAWAVKVARQREVAVKNAWHTARVANLWIAMPRLASMFLGFVLSHGLVLTLTNAAVLGLAALGDRRGMRHA